MLKLSISDNRPCRIHTCPTDTNNFNLNHRFQCFKRSLCSCTDFVTLNAYWFGMTFSGFKISIIIVLYDDSTETGLMRLLVNDYLAYGGLRVAIDQA